MEITRIFHPVGQGGFYTEIFDDSTNKSMIVFDCGGNSSKSMRNYIDSFLPSKDKFKATIEAVFISHLHDDHINGLQYLLDRANVKKIFLPQFNTNRLFDIFFYNASHGTRTDNSNNFVLSLITPTNTIGETTIIQVPEANGDINYREYADQMHQVSLTIELGIPQLENGWEYIPFNPKSASPEFNKIEDPSIKQKLESLYYKNNETNIYEQAKALAEFVKSCTVKQCKELYGKMFGGIHNGQSMTLFSGLRKSESNVYCYPFHSPYIHFYRYFWRDCLYDYEDYNENCIPVNFLYTGDYEAGDSAKMKELSCFYTKMKVWETICGVQIPHHGSRNNYANELYNKRCYAIASAGASNKFHHPNIDTLINIFHQGCKPFVVTEDKSTIIMQYFRI